MKKKVLLSFVFAPLIFNFTSAQPVRLVNDPDPNHQLIKLHYENSGGEKGVTTFDYNVRGDLTQAVWELLDKTRHSINYYSYNNKNQLVRKYREFSDSITSEETFEYNTEGQLIKENFTRSDGISGSTEYILNENGRIIKTICRNSKGWLNADISYLYNDPGKKSKGFVFNGNDQIGDIKYDFDNADNLVRETWDFNGRWRQEFNYEYESKDCKPFTSSNVFIRSNCDFILILEEYTFNDETVGPSYFEYDNMGKLVKKEFIRSDNLKTVTTYVYNDLGQLISSHRTYSDNKTAIFSYAYNSYGQMISRTFERSDGLKGAEEYTYDAHGKLIQGIYENFDSWLNGEISFEHDEYGNLLTGHFKGKDNFDAEINFTCDAYGNVIRIH